LAQTAPVSGYKALVCVFLFGGNDANNTLVPTDTVGYNNYTTLRGPLALPQSRLIQLASLPYYGLHGSLPEIAQLVDSGAAALVANVGTLVAPTTRANVTSQLNLAFEPVQPLGSTAAVAKRGPVFPPRLQGWAGRMSDLLGSSFNPSASIPMITSVAGDTLFLRWPIHHSTGGEPR